MKKFLVLYKSSATAAEQMAAGDPAAAQEAMGLWMAWMEKAGPAIVDGGSPLGDPTVLPSDGGGCGSSCQHPKTSGPHE